MAGYTLHGVAGRIRDLETRVGGAYYVALCWLAMNRDSGKGAKKRLEDKVFGIDKLKVTSTFRNAWRIAEKSFAEGFHAECRMQAVALELDEAVKFAMDRLEAHRTALGATSMAIYEELCKYSDKSAIPAAVPEASPERGEGAPAADNENVDVLANIKAAISQLTLEQATDVAEWLAAHINAATVALEQPEARAA